MTVGEFAKVFDKTTGFIAVIDSAKNWSTDAVVMRDVSSAIESEMIIDRIAYFNAPVFMILHRQCAIAFLFQSYKTKCGTPYCKHL